MKEKIPLMIFAFVICVQPVEAKEYIHPKIKSKEKLIQTVVVLPPVVVVQKSGMKGGESMLEESEKVTAELARIVSVALKERGMEVLETSFKEAALQEDPDLGYSLADMQSRYDALAPQLHDKPKDVRKARFTLGEDIGDLYPDALPDAFVFIRSQGMMLTGGKKAFGWLVAGPKNHKIESYICLVDSLTGEVLFISKIGASGDFVENTDKVLAKKISKSFEKKLK